MACLMLTKPFKWSQLGGAKTRLGCSSLRFIYEILTSTTTVKCVYIYIYTWDVTQLTIRNSYIPSLQCEPHNVEPKYLHLRHWSGHGGSSFCGHSHTPHFLCRLEKTMSQSLESQSTKTGVMYGHVTSSQKKGCTQLAEPLLGMVYYYWLGHINQKNDEKIMSFPLVTTYSQ